MSKIGEMTYIHVKYGQCGHYMTYLTIQAIKGFVTKTLKNQSSMAGSNITNLSNTICIYGLKIQSSCSLQTTNENLKPQKGMRVLY